MDLSSKKRIAFICSGGAVKAAAFHTGVALSLERLGFRFQGGLDKDSSNQDTHDPSRSIRVYVGSSAGSLVAAYLAQGGSLKELLALYQRDRSVEGIPGLKYRQMLSPRVRGAKDFLGIDGVLLSLLKNRSLQSPFTTFGIRDYLLKHVIQSDRFSALSSDLFIVATELNSLKKVVFSRYKSAPADAYLEYRNDVAVSDACAASMSLPPLYHPYTIETSKGPIDYFDGEIQEPLSAHIGRDIDCDLVICSYTHQPLRLKGGESFRDKGMLAISLQAVYHSIEQKIRYSRGQRRKEKALLDRVHRFCKEKGLDPKVEEELCEEIEARLTYKSHIDYIYIHPKASDLQMFMLPHFSLNRRHTENIVKRGYIAGLSALRGTAAKL